MKTELDFYNKPAGFTVNMAHYSRHPTEVRGRNYIVNNKTYLRVYVDSTYELGYVFGAFLSVGISDIPKHSSYMGQVCFYTNEDVDKLVAAIKESFNLDAKVYQKPNNRKVVAVHSKPLARFFAEFGKKEQRSLPDKYLVNNAEYLHGILDGIQDFKGHIPDSRNVLNPRKLSQATQDLYYSIIKHLNN